MIEKEKAFFYLVYPGCFEFKCQNFGCTGVYMDKLRKRSLKMYSFLLRFEENREKRQNVVFILVFIYYLFALFIHVVFLIDVVQNVGLLQQRFVAFRRHSSV